MTISIIFVNSSKSCTRSPFTVNLLLLSAPVSTLECESVLGGEGVALALVLLVLCALVLFPPSVGVVAGDGVVSTSSPSSSGFMGGVLITPDIQSSADRLRSSPASSE